VSAFFNAIEEGNSEVVKLIFRSNPEVANYSVNNVSVVEHTLKHKNNVALKLLLDAGMNPNHLIPYTDEYVHAARMTGSLHEDALIIIHAIANRNNEAIKLLLDNDAEPNYVLPHRLKLRWAPELITDKASILVYAIASGNSEAVKLLLDKGADSNYITLYKEEEEKVSIEQPLLTLVLENLQVLSGSAPLGTPINDEILELLLDNGADPNYLFSVTSPEGEVRKYSILGTAIRHQQFDAINILRTKQACITREESLDLQSDKSSVFSIDVSWVCPSQP